MTWDEATLSAVDAWWGLNEIDFLTSESIEFRQHDGGGLLTGMFNEEVDTDVLDSSVTRPLPSAEKAPTADVDQTPAPVESEWCVRQGDHIPINRSCFRFWPFTIESGELRCEAYDVFFVDRNGNEYGVNGNASGSDDYLDIEQLLTDQPAERGELQSMINFVSGIPGCEIDGIGEHVVPGPDQTTSIPPAATFERLGQIEGISICQDSIGDVETSATRGYLDIAAVQIAVTEQEIQVTWQMNGDVPEDIGAPGLSEVEDGSFSVRLWSVSPDDLPAGESDRSLLLNIDLLEDGPTPTYEASGSDSFSTITRQSGQIFFDGNSLRATFQIDELPRMPSRFAWNSFVEVNFVRSANIPATALVRRFLKKDSSSLLRAAKDPKADSPSPPCQPNATAKYGAIG